MSGFIGMIHIMTTMSARLFWNGCQTLIENMNSYHSTTELIVVKKDKWFAYWKIQSKEIVLRTALCLTGMALHPGKKIVGGQMWNGKTGKRTPVEWTKGLEHYQKHILSKNDIDVFIHSPNVDIEQELKGAYKPKDAIFETDPSFNFPGSKGDRSYPDGITNKTQITAARWYSIQKCMQLKQKYEKENSFKYDMVMIGRFDVAWMIDVDFSKFDPNYFYASNWCVMRLPNGHGVRHEDWFFNGWDKKTDQNLRHTHIGYMNDPNYQALADYWFFGGSEIMDKFSNLYDNLHLFLSQGVPSNHEFALKQLRMIGCLPKLKFAFHIHNDCFLIRHLYSDWRK